MIHKEVDLSTLRAFVREHAPSEEVCEVGEFPTPFGGRRPEPAAPVAQVLWLDRDGCVCAVSDYSRKELGSWRAAPCHVVLVASERECKWCGDAFAFNRESEVFCGRGCVSAFFGIDPGELDD